MQAMVLQSPRTKLIWTELPDRSPGAGEIRVKVAACGVCRTDLHVVDGELPTPTYPIIPGHEIVGRVDAVGAGVEGLHIGERVGLPWVGHTCGVCPYCAGGHENLCDAPRFNGFTRDGGFATATIADARFAFPLGEAGTDVALAPLLCAGLIGWRALGIAGAGENLGLYGFGAAAHILAQVARWQGRSVCFHSPWGHGRSGLCAQPGRRMGRRLRGAATREAGRRYHLRADWQPRAPGLEDRAQGRPGRMRRYPHE